MSQDIGSTGPDQERRLEDSLRILREQLSSRFLRQEQKQALANKIATQQKELDELRRSKRSERT